ncbi:MAG: DUF3160 domain-containing protein [Spirochaetales bacterium]|nr:DUF3160 domain-containing protein [Spirochaetales bacterium]
MKKNLLPVICFFLIFMSGYLSAQVVGDANNDGSIDIIDALIVAQYYVGIQPTIFYESVSDVNGDGSIDIIDALMIAQLYVGIIKEFPAEKWIPYTVTASQTELRVTTQPGGETNIEATLTFSDAGYRVADWGEMDEDTEAFSVDTKVERWTGGSAQVITVVTHTYCPGVLPPGNYTFTFMCWGKIVKSVEFIIENTGTPTPVPSYPVPENLDDVREFESFDKEAEQMLLSNGFVVLGNSHYDRLSSLYFKLFGTDTEVTTFVTTDAMLHVFHMVYDNLLKTAEKTSLALKMEELINAMNTGCAREYNGLAEGAFLKEAARRLWIVFAVGDALIRGETEITGTGTDPIRDEANEYLTKVYDHTLTEYYPGDDYTMYEPRGHYAGDTELEQYFRAVKWISRRIFRVYDPASVEESEYELAGAAIMAYILISGNSGALETWEELYTFTSLLIDTADSITPLMVEQAMEEVFGIQDALEYYLKLEDHDNLVLLREELLSDRYPESEIIPVPLPYPDLLPKKYVQFMGERYVIDGEAMQRTCFPDVGDRILPRGLDVAATVLASGSAYEELEEEMSNHPGLKEQVDILKEEFTAISPEKWQRSTYNSWLYTLKSLSEIPAGAVPDCMKTGLWQREKLNTQMASWAELRHDNILYAKQTMIPSPWNEGRGLVEPYPEFYARLQRICGQLVNTMDTCGIDLPVHRAKLHILSVWAGNFGRYAEKIVDGIPLTAEEQRDIKTWGLDLLSFFSSKELPEDDPELIADVASSSMTGEVLHEAVGKLNPIILLYKDSNDNKNLAAVGYVMSYYELIEPDWNRLNDDEWKERLATDPPSRPSWTTGYCQQ